MHTTLLLSENWTPLGLADWDLWSPGNREGLELQDDQTEAQKWFNHLQTISECSKFLNKEVVMIADREADITTLMVSAKRSKVPFVIRTKAGLRGICSPERGKLLHYLQRQEPNFYYEIKVEKRNQLLGRKRITKRSFHKIEKVRLRVSAVEVELNSKYRDYKGVPIRSEELRYNSILVEDVSPKNKENHIQWLLLTDLDISSEESIREIVAIYKQRWQIEEYFKTLKSGCAAGKICLRSRKKLSRYICMKSIIATEVYQLKEIGRAHPKTPCDEVLTESQWKTLVLIIQQLDGKPLKIPKSPPSMQQAMEWVGRLGGHLGRRRDGPPGVTTLWRGYQELNQKTQMFEIMRSV